MMSKKSRPGSPVHSRRTQDQFLAPVFTDTAQSVPGKGTAVAMLVPGTARSRVDIDLGR